MKEVILKELKEELSELHYNKILFLMQYERTEILKEFINVINKQ